MPWTIGGVIGLVLLAFGELRGGPLLSAAGFLIFSAGFLWFIEKKVQSSDSHSHSESKSKSQ
jgi:hypothetical protein